MPRLHVLLLALLVLCRVHCLQGRRLAKANYLTDFELELPPGVQDVEVYASAIVKDLVRIARLSEVAFQLHGAAFDFETHIPEEACCVISKLPLLVRDSQKRWVAGPWGLAAIVAPAARSRPRVNLYRKSALASWYCSRFTDPLVGGAVEWPAQVFKLSDVGTPLCDSDLPPEIPDCQPPWRARRHAELDFAVLSMNFTNLAEMLPALDDETVQCRVMPSGRTALHLAVGAVRPLEYVHALLTRFDNASVGAQTRGGWTALHLAVSFGTRPVVGAILEKTDYVGLTAVIAHPSDYHHGSAGNTALHFSAVRGFADITHDLAERMDSSALNIRNGNGCTALHLAMELNKADVVKELVPRMDTAGLRLLDELDWTALHRGVRYGASRAVEAMLSFRSGRAVLPMRTYLGWTVLHLASLVGEVETIDVLLEYLGAAEIEAKSTNGMTALMTALSQTGYSFRWRHKTRAAEIILRLLTKMDYACISSRDLHGRTALHWLVISKFLKEPEVEESLDRIDMAAKMLLTAFEPDEARAQDYGGRTALHWAAKEGIRWVVVSLLELYDRGAADLQDVDGLTALHLASGAGHVQVVQELLRFGVSLDQVDSAGATAFGRARQAKRYSVMLRLFRARAWRSFR